MMGPFLDPRILAPATAGLFLRQARCFFPGYSGNLRR
jgi:hypothetical protein